MRAHKKHGILVAGVNGFKIYILNGHYRVVARYGFIDIEQGSYAESVVARYANLKYQPLSERKGIIDAFLTLTETILI